MLSSFGFYFDYNDDNLAYSYFNLAVFSESVADFDYPGVSFYFNLNSSKSLATLTDKGSNILFIDFVSDSIYNSLFSSTSDIVSIPYDSNDPYFVMFGDSGFSGPLVFSGAGSLLLSAF